MENLQHHVGADAIDHRDQRRACLRHVENLLSPLRAELLDGDFPPDEVLTAARALLMGTLPAYEDGKVTQRSMRRLSKELRTTGGVTYAGRPVSLI